MFLKEYKAHAQPELTVLIGAFCPACLFEHGFRVEAEYWAKEGKDVWQFDGNFESPTFVGSMLSRSRNRSRICHSFLKAGVWKFLEDCTHAMAGQSAPMIPYPDNYITRI